MKGDRLKKVFSNLEDCPTEYVGQTSNRFINIKNQRYGKLQVLYHIGSKNKRAEWVCQCDCGKYVIVNSHNLRSGHTQSCGCLISEKLREDLVGKQFGNFKVLKYLYSKNETPRYQIQCINCGRIKEASARTIKEELVGCKCTTKSKAAQIIYQEFYNSELDYITNFQSEKTFKDCKFHNYLKFDFYILPHENFDNGILIEYDGEQHYRPSKFVTKISDEQMYTNYISTQVRDWIKDYYCINKNIPLVRIKYTNKKNATFNEIYNNAYIVGKAQKSDKRIDILGLLDNDFTNNKIPSFTIMLGISCTFKCCKNKIELCQNYNLINYPKINCDLDDLIERYLNQNIAKCISFMGLECLDNIKQLMWFIYYFRKKSNDPIYIWTGYTKEECKDFIFLIVDYLKLENIYMKFGRYVPDQKPHKDGILGVELASDNQYAEKIS